MSRKVNLLVLVLVVLFTMSGESDAAKSVRRVRLRPGYNYSYDGSNTEEARRDSNLISESAAQNIVREQLGTNSVKFFGRPNLLNKAQDYAANGDYKPVYEMKCEAEGSIYNIDVDAISGQVLKLAYAN